MLAAATPAPALLLSLFLASPPSPPTGEGVLRALPIPPEASQPLRLDGLLTEPFWALAPPISDFREMEPREGEAATEATEVRVAYDREYLYIGIRALDSEPQRIVSRILQRDRLMETEGFSQRPVFAGDDAVAILLDPFLDRRNAYIFATNPNGAQFDALLADEGKEFNVDWRGVWEVAAARTPEGWSAEFRIPLRTLRYPEGSKRPWGFNVYRVIRRKNELALWRSWSRDTGGFHRVSLAGQLEGLSGLPSPGRNLELKPYLLGGSRESRSGEGALDRAGEAEVGLDVKVEVRPGLVLDLTFNTDFAQVEVDDEQVNLTRFGLFFPEKRDFFLENSGIFDFGIPGNPFEPPPFQLFFSRQIGIQDDGGTVAPLLGGGRLTGRVGGQTVGVLNVVTGEGEGAGPRESFSVARVKRDVGESSYLGLMVTDRRSSGEWNTVAGADGSLYLTPSLNLQGWLAQTFSRGPGGDDLAYALMVDYTTDRWGGFTRHMAIGPEAEARLGFIQRTDVRRTDVFARRSFRPQRHGIRKLDLFAGGKLLAGMSGVVQDWSLGPFLSVETESGDRLTLMLGGGENRPGEGFDLAGTVRVPPGAYGAANAGARFSTSPSRPLSLEGNLRQAEFYGGTLRSLGGTLNAAPSPQVALALGHTRNRVEVPGGSFTADIASLRAGYAFSTRLILNLLLQYNSLSEVLGANLRLHFIHRRGSDLFLIITENRGVEGDRRALQDRGWWPRSPICGGSDRERAGGGFRGERGGGRSEEERADSG